MANTLVTGKPTISYTELQVLLQQAANITNDRPVGLLGLTEDELVPLMVNQLLLGRNSYQACSYDDHGELTSISTMKQYAHDLLQAWWSEWKQQNLPYLLPFHGRKHAEPHPDL